MNILVTYWSQTGNTRKIAEAIYKSISCTKELKTFEEVESCEGFDLIFIGFPVMQFGPPQAARKFIASRAAGKSIALFITHAMFSESKDPAQQAMLAKELDKCTSICSKANLRGLFHCQGELSEKITSELLATGIPILSEFAAMRPGTIGHPDRYEVEEARNFARMMISA